MAAELREACERIHKLSQDVRILGRLKGAKSTLVSAAVRVMTTPQTERPFKVYREFLYDIRRAAGCSMVVLSSASLGKNRVVQLKAELRTILVDYIACHARSLESPGLLSLTAAFGVPGNEDDSRRASGRTSDLHKGEPPHTQKAIAAKQIEYACSTPMTYEATVDSPGHDDQTRLPPSTQRPIPMECSRQKVSALPQSAEYLVSPKSPSTNSLEADGNTASSPRIPSTGQNKKKPRDPITVPLNLGAVEVLRDVVKGGHGKQLQIIFPDPYIQQPFMLIPLEIASMIMRKYRD